MAKPNKLMEELIDELAVRKRYINMLEISYAERDGQYEEVRAKLSECQEALVQCSNERLAMREALFQIGLLSSSSRRSLDDYGRIAKAALEAE